MFKQRIEKDLIKAVIDLGFVKPNDTVVSISEKSGFGDYSSNIALQLSKQKHQNSYQSPQEIANAIIDKLGHPYYLERVELAGPGFINFFIKDSELASFIVHRSSSTAEDFEQRTTNNPLRRSSSEASEQRTIIVEYCEPNTHKMLHVGHLLSLTLGETLSRLYEYQGHQVIRTNYGSDIGLTVGKCLYGVEKLKDKYDKVKASGTLRDKAQFLGEAYAYGHGEYEKSVESKEEIDQITNKLYSRESDILPIWDETKDWSLGYFETIYSIFGTLFDRRINESEVDKMGKQIVLQNVPKIFQEDDGAVIYPGEKYGLHNRVFINSKGNPTYEAKDIGLADKYIESYQFDEIHIFSHKEQDDYFKVIIDAENRVFPEIKDKVHHVSYGEVKLSSGKMSSRTGNIVAAEDIYNTVRENVKAIAPHLPELSLNALAVAAIKFAFLKYSPRSDIIYDIEESVSLHGDTGPYVLYVFARINSLLNKAQANRHSDNSVDSEIASSQAPRNDEEKNRAQPSLKATAGKQNDAEAISRSDDASDNHAIDFEAEYEQGEPGEEEIAQEDRSSLFVHRSSQKTKSANEQRTTNNELEPEEREVLRQLEYFDLIVNKAADNFQPNELVKYLLVLTKSFNAFYEKHPVIGSKNEEFRLSLASRVAEQIKLGLYLLGIETVDKM